MGDPHALLPVSIGLRCLPARKIILLLRSPI